MEITSEDLSFKCLDSILDSIEDSKKIKLAKYASLVMEYNKNVNVTGASNAEIFIREHIMDSLYASDIFKNRDDILDIGSGAGVPSIPLAIIYENKKFTLCESKIKKAEFLKKAKRELSLNNVEIKCVNVYEIKDKYDTITSRAFSDLKTLLKLFKKLKTEKGILAAYKGKIERIEDELKDVKDLNKYIVKIIRLDNKEKERNIVVISEK